MRGRLGGFGTWGPIAAALVLACKGAEPARDQGRVEVIESEPGTTSAADDRAGGEAEATTGASETKSGETETGDTETGEMGASQVVGARLCSRPYTVSSTPGKGSQSAGATSSPDADAKSRARLERGLEVQVDELPSQAWTTKQGVTSDGLDPSAKHVIVIRDSGGRKLKAMVLDFERRGSEDLCLGLNSFYGTWQLRALRPGAKCGPCTTREPAR